jgi:hypothetical protein
MSSCRGSFLNLTGTNRTNLVLNDVGTAYSHFQLVQLLRGVDTLDEVCYSLHMQYLLYYYCWRCATATAHWLYLISSIVLHTALSVSSYARMRAIA